MPLLVVEACEQCVECVRAPEVEERRGGALAEAGVGAFAEAGVGPVVAAQQPAEEALTGGHGAFGDPLLGGGEHGGAHAVRRQGEIGGDFRGNIR